MNDSVTLLWLPSLLISIVSLLVFLYLSFRSRRRIDRLEQRVRDDLPLLVEGFLQREVQTTRQRLRALQGPRGEQARSLEQLRLHWLEAELVALVEHGRRRSDFTELQKTVQPLLRLINRPAQKDAAAPAAAPAQWDNQSALGQLQKARDAIASQRQVIGQYQQTATASPGFTSSLHNVEQNNAELLATIERLECELQALQARFEETSSRLRTAENHSTAARPRLPAADGTGVLVVAAAKPAASDASRELLAEIEQAYQQSVVEMGRMRDINREQRALILQLETELTTLHKDSGEHHAASELLEKMKLQLRDYENCTVILEMESDSLRERINALNHLIEDNGSTGGPATPMAMAPALPMERSAEQNSVVPLLVELIGLKTGETIAAQLMEWLRQQKLSAVLFIKGAQEQLWSSSEGPVDNHSRQLLQSIVPLEGQPLVEVDEGLLLIYPICRLLIYANPDLGRNGELSKRLQLVAQTADRCLQQLQTEQTLSQLSRVREDAHQRLASLLIQYDYISAEHERVRDKLGQDLEQFLNAAQVSAVQRQVANGMLEDFDAQIELIAKAGKLIHTGLNVTVHNLDKNK